MAQLAQVIVDVPTMQTNRPYTYQVPTRLENQVQLGMRVVVPFGNGKRQVQGFVVGLDQPTKYSGQLKAIDALMDLQPVIGDELLSQHESLKLLMRLMNRLPSMFFTEKMNWILRQSNQILR